MRYIDKQEIATLKTVLLNGTLTRPIKLKFTDSGFEIVCTNITDCHDSEHFKDQDMKERELYAPDGDVPLTKDKRRHSFFINIGNWGRRKKDTHVCMGTSAWHSYFAQVELSKCLSDGESLYISKRISTLAGEGAIQRINNGVPSREEQFARRDRLLEILNADTIEFENIKYLVVSAIKLADLNELAKRNRLFTGVLEDMIHYALAVESIVACRKSIKPFLTRKPGAGFRSQMSAADRKRIEKAAENYAITYFSKHGFDVRIVSDVRGLGYDLEARKTRGTVFVEVKGTTINDWSVVLTRNEYKAAASLGKRFVLFVVVFEGIKSLKVIRHEPFFSPTKGVLSIEPETYSVCRV